MSQIQIPNGTSEFNLFKKYSEIKNFRYRFIFIGNLYDFYGIFSDNIAIFLLYPKIYTM